MFRAVPGGRPGRSSHGVAGQGVDGHSSGTWRPGCQAACRTARRGAAGLDHRHHPLAGARRARPARAGGQIPGPSSTRSTSAGDVGASRISRLLRSRSAGSRRRPARPRRPCSLAAGQGPGRGVGPLPVAEHGPVAAVPGAHASRPPPARPGVAAARPGPGTWPPSGSMATTVGARSLWWSPARRRAEPLTDRLGQSALGPDLGERGQVGWATASDRRSWAGRAGCSRW
jgi:hypothetical protein